MSATKTTLTTLAAAAALAFGGYALAQGTSGGASSGTAAGTRSNASGTGAGAATGGTQPGTGASQPTGSIRISRRTGCMSVSPRLWWRQPRTPGEAEH